jgi:hypothetical protein
MLMFVPSPLAGEGNSEFQQTKLGEGVSTFESSEEAPSPNRTDCTPSAALSRKGRGHRYKHRIS